MKYKIEVSNLSVYRAGKQLLDAISFSLEMNDYLAISGSSGSGKTLLGQAIAKQIFFKGNIYIDPAAAERIVWVEQLHHFKNRSNTGDLYYQQRFNSFDAEDSLTVAEALLQLHPDPLPILTKMTIGHLADKPLLQLSNGENKKFQLAKALLQAPTLLIMDQPFVGLDADTRQYLHKLINDLATNTTIILITDIHEIPACINKIAILDEGKLVSFGNTATIVKEFAQVKIQPKHYISQQQWQSIADEVNDDFITAIRMKNVQVSYGDKKVLQQINWEVKKGERWLLSGPNGAGKSTLLSLVTADNPQGYANHIFLFDRKRGSGESIWDIKRKIGFLSPELHVYFDNGNTCFETIASGLFDTIGLFRQLDEDDIAIVNKWISLIGLEKIKDKRLFEMSAGEQRVTLLARALVKNPPLLILDEPCQGLDDQQQTELLSLLSCAVIIFYPLKPLPALKSCVRFGCLMAFFAII